MLASTDRGPGGREQQKRQNSSSSSGAASALRIAEKALDVVMGKK